MTRSLYLVGGLVALSLVFIAQSVVLVPTPRSGAAAQAEAAPAAVPTEPDAYTVAIDDLAAWPAATVR